MIWSVFLRGGWSWKAREWMTTVFIWKKKEDVLLVALIYMHEHRFALRFIQVYLSTRTQHDKIHGENKLETEI